MYKLWLIVLNGSRLSFSKGASPIIINARNFDDTIDANFPIKSERELSQSWKRLYRYMLSLFPKIDLGNQK